MSKWRHIQRQEKPEEKTEVIGFLWNNLDRPLLKKRKTMIALNLFIKCSISTLFAIKM